MKQDLEKYLTEKRFLLDTEQPDESLLWEGIGTVVKQRKRLTPNFFLRAAAIFLLGVLVGYGVEILPGGNRYKSLADVSPELGRQETELRQTADLKWEQVKPLLANGSNQYQFLLNELEELEKIQKVYLNDLNEVGVNEEIVRVLLDCHEKKIRILDRLLLEIQKQKNHEEQV